MNILLKPPPLRHFRAGWPAGARLPLLLLTVGVLPALLLALAPAGIAQAQAASRGILPYPPPAREESRMRGPGLRSARRLPLGARPSTAYRSFRARPVEGAQRPLFLGLLAFWRNVISPVNGSNSDLAPVHSLYAVQAIKEYGVLLGTVLTTERLIHEPDEIPLAPAFRDGDGRVYHHDPLPWNVYWLPDWLR